MVRWVWRTSERVSRSTGAMRSWAKPDLGTTASDWERVSEALGAGVVGVVGMKYQAMVESVRVAAAARRRVAVRRVRGATG